MKANKQMFRAGFVAMGSIAALLGCNAKAATASATLAKSDQSSKTDTDAAASPATWSLIDEEDFWIPLRYEPLFAMDNARAAWRRHDERAAADSIAKTVSWLRLASLHARPVTRAKLLDAATQLQQLSNDLREGNVGAAAKLEPTLALAADGLADWNYYKVTEFWGRSEERAAGRDLEVAAKYLQQAADSAHYQFGPDTRATLTQVFTKGKESTATASYDHNTLAIDIEGVQKATVELAAAMKH